MASDSSLPGGWCVAKVGDLAQPGEQPVLTGPFGTNLGSDDFTTAGCPVLTIGCLTDAGVRLEKACFVPWEKAKELSRYQLRAGDMLFSRMASVGRASIVPSDLDGALFNYHIMRLRLSNGAYIPSLFISYVRGSGDVRQYLKDVNHGATRDGINTAQLLDMPVVVPPLPEQRRIVAKLDSLLTRTRRAREALDEVPALLERYRQSVLAAAFRGDLTADWREKHPEVEPASELLGRIRAERRRRWEEAELARLKAKGKAPKDDKWRAQYDQPGKAPGEFPHELPPGWCWARAEEVCDLITKGTTPAAEKMTSGSGEIPFIKVYNLTSTGELDFSVDPTFVSQETSATELARSRVLPGDVLMNIVGPPLGKVSVVPDTFAEWNINQAIAIFRPVQGLERAYLTLALLDTVTLGRATASAKATAGQFNLTLQICRDMLLPLAPLEEQREIARRVGGALARLGAATHAHEGAVGLNVSLEQAILSKAFRGELVPQDPSDEPASKMLERIRAEREAGEKGGGKAKAARGEAAGKARARKRATGEVG